MADIIYYNLNSETLFHVKKKACIRIKVDKLVSRLFSSKINYIIEYYNVKEIVWFCCKSINSTYLILLIHLHHLYWALWNE